MDATTAESPETTEVTLLALVTLLDSTTGHPDETEEAVHALLETRRARLKGNFRGALTLR